ncbi:MAG: hypothetical protein HYV63_08875, partial [Candidatus Schekmanbacteria bacterium]|nr:hypothetical protein [Candidatus Schekmanbacteria bacterium]
MIRYADDAIILCQDPEQARRALERVQTWAAAAGLTLHPTKTTIVDATQRGGFDFLGYHFERGYRWPRKKSLKKLKDAIRCVDDMLKKGYHYVVDLDYKSYFYSIPHGQLLARMKEKIADGRILSLVDAYLTQEIMDTTNGWT